jgi:hypothetical protein
VQAIDIGRIAKNRFITGFVALGVAAGSLTLLAAPASAADGPPTVGCTTGSSCMIELNYNVNYTGSHGGHNGVVVPPPPCIGVPVGNAHTGSEAIMSLYGDTAPVEQPSSPPPSADPTPTDTGASAGPTDPVGPTDGPTDPVTPTAPVSPTASASPTDSTATASTTALILHTHTTALIIDNQQQAILDQAKQLVNTKPMAPGEWYQVAGNPSATSAAQQKCNTLPPYIWQPGAQGTLRIDGLNIPPQTLAALAYSQLNTAQLGKVTLNPTGASDTNLPTFIDVALHSPARGVLSVTTDGDPYVWATAATPDGTAATVWAWVTGLTITPGTADATTFNDQRCSTAHLSTDGHTYMLGSRYTAAEMAAVGAGAKIDCGVTYTSPGTYGLTANVSWDACWAEGLATAGGPPAGCKPVPGATGLTDSTTQPVQVNVRDIQSVNNG